MQFDLKHKKCPVCGKGFYKDQDVVTADIRLHTTENVIQRLGHIISEWLMPKERCHHKTLVMHESCFYISENIVRTIIDKD